MKLSSLLLSLLVMVVASVLHHPAMILTLWTMLMRVWLSSLSQATYRACEWRLTNHVTTADTTFKG